MPYSKSIPPRKLLLSALISTAVATFSHSPSALAAPSVDQGQQQTMTFNIPAGPLDKVLNRFARQAGVRLAINGALTAGKASAGLQGRFSLDQALRVLLTDTGLSHRFTDANTLTLQAETTDNLPKRLDTVVVKGEKVGRGLADTASSVVVFDDLAPQATLSTTNDLLGGVSNVVSTEGTNLAPAIRGIDGTGPAQGAMAFFAGSRTRMGMLIDGRPAEFNELVFGDMPLWDVEQVETFRGPQSTLNGRNAIAGAMVVTTRNPTFEPEGAVRISAASRNSRQLAAMYSAPLSDDWAYRIAAEGSTRESYLDYHDYPGASHADEYRSAAIRAKLLYAPQHNSGFTNLFTVSHRDYQSPQGEGIVRPFEQNTLSSNLPAIFNPSSTNASMETSLVLNDTFTLENSLVYSDINVERTVADAGRGNAEIDTRTLLIEPRLRFDNDTMYGFIGLHIFDAEQDEFIDIRNSTYDDSTRNIALFGETNFALSDRTELSLGGRWERETRKRSGGNAPFAVELDETYSAFSPKATLNYALDDQWTVGALVSRGFNGGGAGVTFEQPFVSYSYEPERVWNYEAFTRGELLDGRLSVSANLFYADYTNMQIPVSLAQSAIVIRNAQEARSYGMEFGARWLPTPQLQLFTDIGLLKTEITDYAGTPVKGNELPRSPSFSAQLGWNYQFNNGVELGGDARYTHRYFSDVDNTDRTEIDSYWVTNMQASYQLDGYRLFAFVKNITDEDNLTIFSIVGNTPERDIAIRQQPRTVGAGIEMQF